MADLELMNLGLKIEMVKGKSAIENCCICDEQFISKTLQELTHEATEDDSIGIFVKNDRGIIVSTAIIEPKDDGRTMELQLLCANTRARVPGATQLTLKFVAETALKWEYENIILFVAQYERNNRANSFYRDIFKMTPVPYGERAGALTGSARVMASVKVQQQQLQKRTGSIRKSSSRRSTSRSNSRSNSRSTYDRSYNRSMSGKKQPRNVQKNAGVALRSVSKRRTAWEEE